MTNRNPVKQWFLTFPQWSTEKYEFRNELVTLLSPYYYKIARETHEDGKFHYHVILVFKKGLSKARLLKMFKNQYPEDNKRIHIRPVRSIKHAMQYISKEDLSPLESEGGWKETRNPQNAAILRFLRQIDAIPSHYTLEKFQSMYKKEKERLKERQRILDDMIHLVESGFALDLISRDEILATKDGGRFFRIMEKSKELEFSDISISKDDMTFFLKFYKNNLELYLPPRRRECSLPSEPKR